MQPKLQPRWFLTRGHKENGIWLLSFTDIDCYKRREEALTHNYVIAELGNSRYETIKSSGFTGMFVVQVEPPRKFVEVNDTFCKLLGYTRDELVGKMSWQDLTPQEYEETDNHQEEKMKQTGSSSSFEKVYITKSIVFSVQIYFFLIGKKRIYVLVAGIILPKEPDLCLAIVSDVTAQKEAEKAALEATQAKSMFLANVSHGNLFSKLKKNFEQKFVRQCTGYVPVWNYSRKLLLMKISQN